MQSKIDAVFAELFPPPKVLPRSKAHQEEIERVKKQTALEKEILTYLVTGMENALTRATANEMLDAFAASVRSGDTGPTSKFVMKYLKPDKDDSLHATELMCNFSKWNADGLAQSMFDTAKAPTFKNKYAGTILEEGVFSNKTSKASVYGQIENSLRELSVALKETYGYDDEDVNLFSDRILDVIGDNALDLRQMTIHFKQVVQEFFGTLTQTSEYAVLGKVDDDAVRSSDRNDLVEKVNELLNAEEAPRDNVIEAIRLIGEQMKTEVLDGKFVPYNLHHLGIRSEPSKVEYGPVFEDTSILNKPNEFIDLATTNIGRHLSDIITNNVDYAATQVTNYTDELLETLKIPIVRYLTPTSFQDAIGTLAPDITANEMITDMLNAQKARTLTTASGIPQITESISQLEGFDLSNASKFTRLLFGGIFTSIYELLYAVEMFVSLNAQPSIVDAIGNFLAIQKSLGSGLSSLLILSTMAKLLFGVGDFVIYKLLDKLVNLFAPKVDMGDYLKRVFNEYPGLYNPVVHKVLITAMTIPKMMAKLVNLSKNLTDTVYGYGSTVVTIVTYLNYMQYFTNTVLHVATLYYGGTLFSIGGMIYCVGFVASALGTFACTYSLNKIATLVKKAANAPKNSVSSAFIMYSSVSGLYNFMKSPNLRTQMVQKDKEVNNLCDNSSTLDVVKVDLTNENFDLNTEVDKLTSV